MLARMEQFTDLLRDSREQIRKGVFWQAILGDLNTLGHGIARLSPRHCNDRMRFSTLGLPEGFIWQERLLDVPDPLYSPQHDHDWAHASVSQPDDAPASASQLAAAALQAAQASGRAGGPADPAAGGGFNHALHDLGVPEETCRHALNPGFEDPWDPLTTETLNNPRYRIPLIGWPLMRGKLDWLLLRRARVAAKRLGNLDYRHSDHRWLCADVTLA